MTQCQCQLPNGNVSIVDAKVRHLDNSKRIVLYTIQSCHQECKRRYSEFESLRNALLRLYPGYLVPPIPEKHTKFSEWAMLTDQGEQNMIDKRKRMLESFLRRLACHPILQKEHVFHRFLQGDVWADVLGTLPSHTTTLSLSDISSFLPLPSVTTTPLRHPDQHFSQREQRMDKIMACLQSGLVLSHKHIVRHLLDLSHDYAALTKIYRTSSNVETHSVRGALEMMSTTAQSTSQHAQDLVNTLAMEVTEQVQEYTGFVAMAQQVIQHHRSTQAKLEWMQDVLVEKKQALAALEQTEAAAVHLDKMLDSPHAYLDKAKVSTSKDPLGDEEENRMEEDEEEGEEDGEEDEDGFAIISPEEVKAHTNASASMVFGGLVDPSTSSYPTAASMEAVRASRYQARQWVSPRNLWRTVSESLQNIMDADPGATRHQHILRLQQEMTELVDSCRSTQETLDTLAETIRTELDRYEEQKQADLRTLLLSFAKSHLAYCEQGMVTWQAARSFVDQC